MIVYVILSIVLIVVSAGIVVYIRKSDKSLEEKQKFFMILGVVATFVMAILCYMLIYCW